MINAIVFPGQGSQRAGMAIDFVDTFPMAHDIFRRASDTLSFDVEEMCRTPDARLNLTEFTQPCILTAEIAMFEVLKTQFGLHAKYYAGHSCGEYAALVAAGVMSLETALRLVHIRGKLMQWAAPVGFGGMIAVVHSERPLLIDTIEMIASRTRVDLANDNSPSQVVISGEKSALALFETQMKEAFPSDDLRLIPLATSAPFHSRHMLEAQSLFQKAVSSLNSEFDPQRASTVLSNTTGTFHRTEIDALQRALVEQVSGRVRWTENMKVIIESAEDILEVGPNRPLGGFFRAIGHEIRSVIDLRSARRIFGAEKTTESLAGGLYVASI